MMTNRKIAILFFVWVVIYLLICINNAGRAMLLSIVLLSFCLLLLLPVLLIIDLLVRFYEQPRKIPFWYYLLILAAISGPFLAMGLFQVFGGDLPHLGDLFDS